MKKILSILCVVSMLLGTMTFIQPKNCDASDILESIFEGGDGSAENPFQISTQEQLAIINDIPTYNFKLINDIELEGDWEPIGSYGDDFSGVFDGCGYTISNLNVLTEETYAGLFGCNKGIIKNLRIEAKNVSTILGDGYTTTYVGSIAGTNNGTILNCCTFGNVGIESNDYFVGGIVGYNYTGMIENCYFYGSVSGVYCGGGIGKQQGDYYEYGIAKNCYIVATVSGKYAGGFIGRLETYTETTSCYYDKQVSSLSDTDDAAPKTTLGMKQKTTYTDWDFENVWGINKNINDGYPYLLCEYVTDIKFENASETLPIGESMELTATILPAAANNRKITWSSSDDEVVSVADGKITAKKIGTATVIASIGDVKSECIINVTPLKGIVCEITNLIIKDTKGNVLSAIPKNEFIAEISVNSLNESDEVGYVLVAAYDNNNTLVDMGYIYIPVNKMKDCSAGILIRSKEVANIKVYVWDSLNNMSPLAETVEYNN